MKFSKLEYIAEGVTERSRRILGWESYQIRCLHVLQQFIKTVDIIFGKFCKHGTKGMMAEFMFGHYSNKYLET